MYLEAISILFRAPEYTKPLKHTNTRPDPQYRVYHLLIVHRAQTTNNTTTKVDLRYAGQYYFYYIQTAFTNDIGWTIRYGGSQIGSLPRGASSENKALLALVILHLVEWTANLSKPYSSISLMLRYLVYRRFWLPKDLFPMQVTGMPPRTVP